MSSQGFLTTGDLDVSGYLSPSDQLRAERLAGDYNRATGLLDKVAQMNGEIDRLSNVLEQGNLRRSERRSKEREIDDLTERSFEYSIEAYLIMEEVNELRYKAISGYLEELRAELDDQVVLRRGLTHEEYAEVALSQADGLRQTARELRSDRYYAEFISRAYNEEMKAFQELDNARDIYQRYFAAISEEPDRGLIQDNGRIDPGLALARSRSSIVRGTEEEEPTPAANRVSLVYKVQLGAFITPVRQDIIDEWQGLAGEKNWNMR